jgi:hypothetical protein
LADRPLAILVIFFFVLRFEFRNLKTSGRRVGGGMNGCLWILPFLGGGAEDIAAEAAEVGAAGVGQVAAALEDLAEARAEAAALPEVGNRVN